jgi:hypothetical protein
MKTLQDRKTMQIRYGLQPETVAHLHKIPHGTIAHQGAQLGIANGEPLLVIMDGLIRYAKAHECRFESKLAEDYVLGPAWLDAAKAIRCLLNGDGAVAHEMEKSTDSKDNSSLEGMFWDAMAVAGFSESDL